MKIYLARPDISKNDIKQVADVLATPCLSLGPKLEEFEKKIAKYTGVKYAAATSNGTAALHLIIKSLGIKKGDEVITTPFSFIASSNCILYEGAKPVFVDIRQDTLNIDTERIEKKITRKTKAILAVDVFGHPAEWSKLKHIARKHNLKLIEDSCEALGSEYKGKKCGSFGDAGVFSFYPNKQITMGEGGVIVTNDKTIVDSCRSMSNQGRRVEGGSWHEHIQLGYNYRLSDINTALGIAQLCRIKEILKKRSKVAQMYNERLRNISGISIPYVDLNVKLSWFVYVVRLSGKYDLKDRNEVIKKMGGKGIQVSNYFRPIHLHPFYKKMFGYKKGDFPVCEATADRAIALPFYNDLNETEIEYVVNNFKRFLCQMNMKK